MKHIIYVSKFYLRKVLLLLVISSIPIPQVFGVNWYISGEQDSREGTGTIAQQELFAHQLVDIQNDSWYLAVAPGSYIYQESFGIGSDIAQGATPYSIFWSGATLAEILRVQMDGPILGTPNGTATQPKLDDSNSLQDGAPYPYSLTGERMRSESAGGSSSARNAVRFNVFTGITGFGAWFGDLETRTDGQGKEAEIQLFDASGIMIGNQTISPSTGNQAGCGGDTSSQSPSACGNETTRRVGFTLTPSEQVSTILVIVGDDDGPGDGGTNDGNTEHLSLIGPTFVFPSGCADTDGDGICNNTDICPDDPLKTIRDGCGCGIQDPLNYGNICESNVNSCGMFGTGTIQCDGSCSAILSTLPERYEEVCESEPNECGQIGTGYIDCSGFCYAFSPELPDGYNSDCDSEANNCGISNTGKIGCDGICTAKPPEDLLDCSCENPPIQFKNSCKSAPNDCGVSMTGSILCDGSCSAVVPNIPENIGKACVGISNICGMYATGNILCDGICSAVLIEDSYCSDGEEISTMTGDDDVSESVPNNEIKKGGSGGSNSRFIPRYCGDGLVNQIDESCDDGNQRPGDGCDLYCQIEINNEEATSLETITMTETILSGPKLSIIESVDSKGTLETNFSIFEELLDTGGNLTIEDTPNHILHPVELKSALPVVLPKTGAQIDISIYLKSLVSLRNIKYSAICQKEFGVL